MGSIPSTPTILIMETKLAIFDFSGTLAYSKADGQSLIKGMESLGFKFEPSDTNLFYDIIRRFLDSTESWQKLAEEIILAMNKNAGKKTAKKLSDILKNCLGFKLYDDAQKAFALPVLKTILTAGSRFLLKDCNIPKDVRIFTPMETKYLKPDPRAFRFVLEQMAVDPRQAIMVGDETERDLIPAASLGMKAFLIERENENTGKPPKGIIKINSLKDLKDLIF